MFHLRLITRKPYYCLHSAMLSKALARSKTFTRARINILLNLHTLYRACRKTPSRETGGILACLFPLDGSDFGSSVCPDGFFPHLLTRTRSRISLFRLKARIDRGPAISSVCHRCSLGLLNPYLSV